MSNIEDLYQNPSPPNEEQDPSLPPEGLDDKGKRRWKRVKRIPYAKLKDSFDQTNIQDLAEQTLNNNGELSAEEYKSLYKLFSKKRLEFIHANEAGRALLIKDVNDKASTLKSFKKFREDFAAAIMNNTIQKGWLETEEGRNYTNLLGNQAQLVEKRCDDDPNCPDKNKLGVILDDIESTKKGDLRLEEIDKELKGENIKKDDEWSSKPKELNIKAGAPRNQNLTTEEREKLLVEKEFIIQLMDRGGGYMTAFVDPSNLNRRVKNVDESSRKVILAMGNQAINQSTRSIEGEHQNFNEGAWRNQLKSNVINKSNNFQSLIYDEMIPGRTMYNDLVARSMAGTYNDLGLANIDGVNPNDGIDEREAKLIVDEMIANPDYKEQLEE